MTTQLKHDDYQLRTAQDVLDASVAWKAISINGTIDGSARTAIGVIAGKAANNRMIPVTYQGITKVSAGAAVGSAGAPLTVTTSGWFVGATSGTYVVGRALTTAASGDVFAAAVDFKTLHYLAT